MNISTLSISRMSTKHSNIVGIKSKKAQKKTKNKEIGYNWNFCESQS